jgi:type I restriction enzyme S subunit
MKQGWEIKDLGAVSQIVNGGTPKSKVREYWDGNINWITPADLGKLETVFVKDTPRKITDLGLKKSSAKLFTENSVILSTRAPIGHLAINKVPMSTNQGCRGIVPNENLDTWFLYYFLKGNIQLLNDLGSGATFLELSTKNLSSVKIPLPPLPEQQRIVSILDECFAAIDKAKANAEQNLFNANELFENSAQGIFTQKGIDWEEKLLGDFAEFRNGINYTKGSKGEKIKIVGVKDFQDSYWVPENDLVEVSLDGKINETDLLREGDILAVRSNGNPQLIGRTLLAGIINEKISHSGFTIRIRLNSKIVNPNYLCHFMKIQQTRKTLVESGNGVGIRSLNQGSLSSLKIPFPKSLKEQELIIKKVDSIAEQSQRLKDLYQKKLIDLEELKKSILQKAFAGELELEKVIAV